MTPAGLRRLAYLTSIGITGVLVSTPALAQAQASGSATASPPAPAAADDKGQVNADSKANSTDQGAIIVTAQRRSQRLLDVPLSVQVHDAQTLERANVTQIADLPLITPGLTFTRVIANSSPYIRGIGTTSPLTGVEAAVATYIDGVYQPATVGNIFSFNNISSIEVLKGPQGTLYGRNATGGVINIITRDPEFTPSVEAKLGYDNFETTLANVYATAGLTNNVAADVAVYYDNQHKGFGRDLTLNSQFMRSRELSLRSRILFRVDDATKIKLTFDHTHTNGDIGVGAVPIRDGQDGAYTNVGFYDTIAGFPYGARVTSTGVAGQLEHNFGGATLKFISAYRNVVSYEQFSQLGDAAIPSAVEVRTNNSERTFTDELQLTSNGNRAFSWIGGIFYMHDRSLYDSPNGFTVDALTPFGQLRVANIVSDQKLNSISGYFDGTLRIGQSTHLTGGIRYTNDARDFVGGNGVTQTVAIVGGVPTVVSVPAVVLRDGKETERKFTYRAVIDHRFDDNLMIYASYSTGFKSGGFAGNAPANDPLKPENVGAFEVGAHATLFDKRLRVSAAAFHYNYKDLQVTRIVGITPISENAAAAKIDGVEVEGALRAARDLHITFGGQYLNARYTNYTNVPAFGPIPGTIFNASLPPIDASGNQLRLAPKWTGNLGFDYTARLGSGELRLAGNYAYNNGYFFYADERVRQGPYSLFSARVGYFFDEGRYGISLWGKNLSNARYFVQCRCGDNAGDFAAYGEPRRYGVELDVRM